MVSVATLLCYFNIFSIFCTVSNQTIFFDRTDHVSQSQPFLTIKITNGICLRGFLVNVTSHSVIFFKLRSNVRLSNATLEATLTTEFLLSPNHWNHSTSEGSRLIGFHVSHFYGTCKRAIKK